MRYIFALFLLLSSQVQAAPTVYSDLDSLDSIISWYDGQTNGNYVLQVKPIITSSERIYSARIRTNVDGLYAQIATLQAQITPTPPPITTQSVIFSDDFSSGDFGKKLPNGQNFWADNSSTYQQPSATKLSSVKVLQEPDGTWAANILYAGTPTITEQARPELDFNLGGQYPEYWVSFKLYIDPNYWHRQGSPTSNNKFFITDNMAGSQFIDRETFPDSSYGAGVDVGSMQLKYAGVNHDFQPPASTWQFASAADRGTWVHYVLHNKVATSATSNDGIAETYKNGVLVQVHANLPNYTAGANYFEQGYMFGAANSGFTVDTTLKLKDVVFSTAPLTP